MTSMSIKSGQYRDLDTLLDELMKLPPASYIPINNADFRPSEGHDIGMDRAGVTNAKSKHPILGTYGLATCMGIALYNPDKDSGGLAHLAQSETEMLRLSKDSKKALLGLLSTLRDDDSEKLEARLIGPNTNRTPSEPFIKDILTVLNQVPNLYFLSADLCSKPYPMDVGIDTRHWDEGLLKGKNSSGLSGAHISTDDKKNMNLFREGMEHVVELTRIPPAPYYNEHHIFDAREKHADIYGSDKGKPHSNPSRSF